MRCGSSPNRGFTVLELMIGVMVIGLIASMAFPAYQNYMYEAYRADAVMQLAHAWKAEQEFRIEYGRYRASYSGREPLGWMSAYDQGVPASLNYRPASGSKYNVIVGSQGAAPLNADLPFSAASLGVNFSYLTGGGAAINQGVFGYPKLIGSDDVGTYDYNQILIGAEGNLDGDAHLDVMGSLNGHLFLICDDNSNSRDRGGDEIMLPRSERAVKCEIEGADDDDDGNDL